MTRHELFEKMDAVEFSNWLAYEMTQIPEIKEKLDEQLAAEKARTMSDEERFAAIKACLNSVGTR